ncbi:MAG: hypothetical protein OEX23_12825 [Betaproteobacteria bacterium]|nr:hypothetical protein [Betaproteobacteria bacterium]
MNRTIKADLRIVVATLAALLFSAAAMADGPARKLPLSAFLDTQGSQNVYIPPVPDYWGWVAPAPGVKTPATSYVGGNAGSCDYAGLANDWLIEQGHPGLGTSFSGSVTERALGDGRILVHVDLRTVNALTFGMRITAPDFGDFATDPLIFGARAQDVLAGATPGIGDCHASFAWKQLPGDLVDFNHPPWDDGYFEIVNLSFRANAKGPLTALAGYGPDGTPGHLVISQTGFFRTSFKGATFDAFPAEFVEVRATGN